MEENEEEGNQRMILPEQEVGEYLVKSPISINPPGLNRRSNLAAVGDGLGV